MRRMTIFLFTAAMLTPLAYAATVDLTDGNVINGQIVQRDNKSLQINVDGVTMTYYADEIKDIDGKPFVTPVVRQAPLPVRPIAPLAGGIDGEKKALILKFIEVFGTRQALSNNFNMMLEKIEKEKPQEAQKIRERVKVDEIIERLIPVYDRNFSKEELRAFIDFYGSPAGQKLITKIPELMKGSVMESIKYMQDKFPNME